MKSSKSDKNPGKLFLVATPIGNLQDITLRALDVLRSVDLIVCEDTRHSTKLFNAYGIHQKKLSLHEHNEATRSKEIIEKIRQGQKVAMVSDAGTPLISDPGYRLVQALILAELPFESIPGPCAAINGLVLSGLPTDRFLFVGFLPPKTAARLRKLTELKEEKATLVFYESGHRIQKFLRDAFAALGPRPAALTREMTKLHEEVVRGPLGELGQVILPRSWKGEWTVIVGGAR